MAEAAQNVQPLRQLQPLQIMIGGLIESARVYEGKQYTTIKCPAKDEFSMPSTLEVKSLRKLGEIGARVAGIVCAVSGFIREFDYTDKRSGELKHGRETNVYFEVVE